MTQKEKGVYYKKSLNWHHIPPITITRYRRFGPSRNIVMKRLGKSVDVLTNEEVAKFIIAREIEKQDAESKEQAKAENSIRTVIGKSHAKRQDTVETLMEEYLKHYSATTPNDLDSLRQLCSLKLAIDDLEKTEHNLLQKLKDPGKHGEVSDTYINSIVNARLKYLTEYRQLQQMLGIDRHTRDKADNETGGVDYMKNLMKSGAELLKSKSVAIRCPTCIQNSTIINMGFVLCHFDNWEFKTVCPKCNSEIYLSKPTDLK